jgi:hypothetical protein
LERVRFLIKVDRHLDLIDEPWAHATQGLVLAADLTSQEMAPFLQSIRIFASSAGVQGNRVTGLGKSIFILQPVKNAWRRLPTDSE